MIPPVGPSLATANTWQRAQSATLRDKGGQVYNATHPDYGATGDGVTDDLAALNALMSLVSTAGGGTIYLPAGTYRLTGGLAVLDNVHLMGAGRHYTKLVLDNGATGPVIGGFGATNVTVSHLWVDIAATGVLSNGIAFMPDGNGKVCSYVVVDACKVTGTPGLHAYMIWNQGGAHVKFTHNFVDGGTDTYNDGGQTGIESQGGTDVYIAGNTVVNIGQIGIDISNDPSTTYPDLSGVRAIGNYVIGCPQGISVGAIAGTNTKSAIDVIVADNNVFNSYICAINVQMTGDSPMKGVKVTNNTINGVSGETGNPAKGIKLWTTDGAAHASVMAGNDLTGNTIRGITGANAEAISLENMPGWVLRGNTIDGSDNRGINVLSSPDCVLEGNVVRNTQYYGIYVQDSDRVAVLGGKVHDWDLAASGAAGVTVDGSAHVAVDRVTFNQASALSYGVRVLATSDSCAIGDNTFLDDQPTYNYLGTNPVSRTIDTRSAPGANALTVTDGTSTLAAIGANGEFQPSHLADADAANDTIYYSTDSSTVGYKSAGGTFTAFGSGGGSGTVTSVGLTVPSGLSVSGSPVTGSGTLAVSTTLSGLIKGDGSGFSAATANTDYLPVASPVFTGSLTGPTVYGSSAASGNLTLQSTSHATLGTLYLNGTTTFIYPSGRLSIGSNVGANIGGGVLVTAGDSISIADLGFVNNYHTLYGIVASNPVLAVQGIASQTGPLVKLQQLSSTSTARDAALVDAAWADATDATRKGRLTLSAADASGTNKEGLRVESDGSAARVSIAAPASAPTDANIPTGQIEFWLDETGNTLNVRVRYSDGTTLKSGSIPLS